MKPRPPLGLGAQVAVAAMVILGMVAGTLIVAHAGYSSSPKRGGVTVFVPAPQAYFLAAPLFGMSVIGWVALIWERRQSVVQTVLSVALYGLVVVFLISYFGRY
jgi:hypothetical protein